MSEQPNYPKKLFYKINEVAKIVGVEDYVLRYWETRFPMLKPEKQRGDQRRYRQKDIELLLKIQKLVHVDKLSIDDAIVELKSRPKRSKSASAAPKTEPKTTVQPTPPVRQEAPGSQPPAAHSNGAAPSPANNSKPPTRQIDSPSQRSPQASSQNSSTTAEADPKRDELRSILEELEAMKNELK